MLSCVDEVQGTRAFLVIEVLWFKASHDSVTTLLEFPEVSANFLCDAPENPGNSHSLLLEFLSEPPQTLFFSSW